MGYKLLTWKMCVMRDISIFSNGLGLSRLRAISVAGTNHAFIKHYPAMFNEFQYYSIGSTMRIINAKLRFRAK